MCALNKCMFNIIQLSTEFKYVEELQESKGSNFSQEPCCEFFLTIDRIIVNFQTRLCLAFEEVDGGAGFLLDRWERAEGGGGLTRVLQDGAVFERRQSRKPVRNRSRIAVARSCGLPRAQPRTR